KGRGDALCPPAEDGRGHRGHRRGAPGRRGVRGPHRAGGRGVVQEPVEPNPVARPDLLTVLADPGRGSPEGPRPANGVVVRMVGADRPLGPGTPGARGLRRHRFQRPNRLRLTFAYGLASQFHVPSPLLPMPPPLVNCWDSHTSPCSATRLAAGSGVAPP